MGTFNEPLGGPDASPAPVLMHVVKPGALEAADGMRPAPLRYLYAHTRVLPDVGERLARLPQVLRPDRSALSETFRMLRSQVLLRMRAQGHRVLAVTSPRALHGKSMTALNLALALAADLDTSALLVDAQLDGRGLQHELGLFGTPGLAEHLLQGVSLPQLLLNPDVERFVMLPAGAQPVPQSADLLGTRAMQHLLDELKHRYADRMVVLDLPPLLEAADTLACLPFVDTTLLVAEEHGTRLRDVEAAAELLAPFNLLGTVMSKPPAERRSQRRRWFERDAP